MSRTYKKGGFGRWGYYRRPKGRKQAKIQGCRNKAIPPDAWDDVSHDKSNFVIYNIARKLHIEKGWNLNRVSRHLVNKYGIQTWQANKITKNGFYGCDCEECNKKP